MLDYTTSMPENHISAIGLTCVQENFSNFLANFENISKEINYPLKNIKLRTPQFHT